ncbi:MAG: NERD domain-containing protein [Chloroflexi bacterium]|nr:NERD domain-containing protein [Chloroflexota bacterium]
MRVIVNEKLVQNRAEWGKRLTFLGLGLLLASVVASFRPQQVLPAYLLMVIGFITVNAGAFLGSKWVKEPRVDQVLAKALKGLDNKYALYSYYLPAEHVLLSPSGLTVLRAKPQEGQITCRGERWHRKFNVRRLLSRMVEEGLGNPAKEVRADVAKMKAYLQKALPDVEVPVDGVIVFTNSEAELHLESPTEPVVRLPELRNYLRQTAKAAPDLPGKALRQVTDALDALAS